MAQLGSTCNACGVTKKSNKLRYDLNTFVPYCDNPFKCGSAHPNSPSNAAARGNEMKLVSYAEAEAYYKTVLESKYANPEMVQELLALIKKSTSLRISDPDLAQFLVRLKAELQLGDISKTIRYCIEYTMKHYGKLNDPIIQDRPLETVLEPTKGYIPEDDEEIVI